jgi:cysteine desulfuration protein SufE
MNDVRSRLEAIIDEFTGLDGREKLELLLDFANGLAPLPPEYEARKATEDRRVHECQTPVFLWPEVVDGTARLIAEVAPEAPTVKGFVAILADAIRDRPAAEAAGLPEDLLERMGLADVLGILRSRGLRSIVAHVNRGIARKIAEQAS